MYCSVFCLFRRVKAPVTILFQSMEKSSMNINCKSNGRMKVMEFVTTQGISKRQIFHFPLNRSSVSRLRPQYESTQAKDHVSRSCSTQRPVPAHYFLPYWYYTQFQNRFVPFLWLVQWALEEIQQLSDVLRPNLSWAARLPLPGPAEAWYASEIVLIKPCE